MLYTLAAWPLRKLQLQLRRPRIDCHFVCHSRLKLPSTCRSISSYLTSPKDLHKAIKTNPPSTVSPEPRVIPLCASWFPANDHESPTGIQTFHQKRIPEARFFDLDKVIDTQSPFPHLLPSALGFAASMSGLGIRREDILVVYDTSELGIFSAPRVGWMLKVFGHPKVHILNNFRLYEEVREAVMDHNKEGREGIQVLDSRSSDDFSGKYPGPRPDSPSGHMPGSINIPYDLVLDAKTKAFLPSDQLVKLFKTKGVDPHKPIISSGTSITAYVIETALNEAQFGSSDSRKVYDGSWSEWTQRTWARGLGRKYGKSFVPGGKEMGGGGNHGFVQFGRHNPSECPHLVIGQGPTGS
ncbi:hypothetical protein MRS44_018881 [Fusarium solani]|uniref:uncharacterized protein n=1 Tax=Fusarium solani TaxID=169388 RepID=UPI0032C3EBFD|nr:hypothetical protein MRS44_018881 [Fusarium solani]